MPVEATHSPRFSLELQPWKPAAETIAGPNEEATMRDFALSRRHLLQGGAAFATAGLAAPAFAKAPMLGTQAPYFYRFKFGNAEATIVSDGPLPLGDPNAAFLGLTKDEIARQLSSNYLPLENAVLEQNALIVNTGNQLVLFDTGMGSAKDFRPTTGKLMASIKADRDCHQDVRSQVARSIR